MLMPLLCGRWRVLNLLSGEGSPGALTGINYLLRLMRLPMRMHSTPNRIGGSSLGTLPAQSAITYLPVYHTTLLHTRRPMHLLTGLENAIWIHLHPIRLHSMRVLLMSWHCFLSFQYAKL